MRHNRMTVADLRAVKGQRVPPMPRVQIWGNARFGPPHDVAVDEAEFADFLEGLDHG